MAAKCLWRANRAERLEVNRATLDIVRRMADRCDSRGTGRRGARESLVV